MTLLKTNKKFKELFIILDIINKDKIINLLKYLVNVKDFAYAINIINALQSNCICKYDFEDFCDNHNIFSELIIMGGTQHEEFLYNFTEYYIEDYLNYLHEMMQPLYDATII